MTNTKYNSILLLTFNSQGDKMKQLILLIALMFSGHLAAKTITLNESNTIILNTEINSSTVAQVQVKAMELSSKNPEQELFLVLNSPGGSVTAGALMIDTLNSLPNRIHTVSLFAASMAYQTVQSLGIRYVLNSSTLMSHRAYLGGVKGTFEQLDSIISLFKNHVANFERVASKRIGMSLVDYKKLIHDDYWVTGFDSVEKGHADAIATVICGKTLQGTYVREYRTMFGNYDVTFSKCPLIQGYLKIKAQNGTEYSNEAVQEIDRLFNDRTRSNIKMNI